MNKQSPSTPSSSATPEQTATQVHTEAKEHSQNKEIPKSISSKHKLLVLTGSFIVVALLGLFATKVLTGIQLSDYINDKQGFSIEYPEKWVIDEKNDDPQLMSTTFSEPYDAYDTSDGSANPAVLTVEKINASAEGQKLEKEVFFELYANAIREAVSSGRDESIPDAEYPRSADEMQSTVDGHDALLITSDIANFQYSEGESGKKYTALIWVNDSLQYTITLRTHNSDKIVSNQWETILSSFKINQ